MSQVCAHSAPVPAVTTTTPAPAVRLGLPQPGSAAPRRHPRWPGAHSGSVLPTQPPSRALAARRRRGHKKNPPQSNCERILGGANGTRTRNPLLAKQVRYQLRHSPVGGTQSSTASVTDVHRSALSERSTRICRTAMPTATTDPTATQQVTHFFMMILRFRSPADGGPRWARTTDLSLIRTAL